MSEIIKIIHFISSLSRGGRERQLSTIVAHSDPQKYLTRIVYLNDAPNSYIDEYELKKCAIKVRPKSFAGRLKALNKIINAFKPDLIFTWGNVESIFILLLKPIHTFVFVNSSVRHGIRSKKLSHYFRTVILHLSPNIIANSYAGLNANNLKKGYVLYNGIADKFLQPLKNRVALRKRLLDIAENIPLLISVANLVPYKDYFSILLALKKLKEDSVNFYYCILGDGPLKSKIQQTIDNYSLQNHVKIMGHRQNVAEFLKIADLFIHSSKGEGCSNAILEAMAAGLPVIASNTGGTNEIVTRNNGWLYQYRDVEYLITLIKKALKDLSVLHSMGIQSQQVVRDKFTIKETMSNYYKLVDHFVSA